MPLPKIDTNRLPFPIVTPEAQKFWSSRHICNRAKAIIAFSTDREQAMRMMRRYLPPGKSYHFRERAWNAWQYYVEMPDMEKVPFTPLSMPWWECIPPTPIDPPKGSWAIWVDDDLWEDDNAEEWTEWLNDITM